MSELKNQVPSDKLNKLVSDWNDEVTRFRQVAKVFQAHVENLGELNSLIWHQCKAEGVDIDSLPMVRNEKPNDDQIKNKSLARKRNKKRD